MAAKTKPIVIVGGGFGGLQAALALDRFYGSDLTVPIFLVDPSPHHIYTPSLYEVANAHSPKVAAIPFATILADRHICFIQEKVTHIDVEAKMVTTEHRQLPYEDLVLALGSETRPIKDDRANPSDVFSVKTIDDVMAIRDHIEACCARIKSDPKNECHTHFILAGAGPTGVEFAASLVGLLRREASFHGLPMKRMHVTLVDAGDRILSRLDPKMSQLASRFLKQIGVEIRLNTKISWEDHEQLRMNNTMVKTETLIWTAGVKPHQLIQKLKGFRHDDHGRVLVDGSLQVIDVARVWVVGDAAAVGDSGLALSATAQGRHVAQAIRAVRHGAIAPAYQPFRWPAIIPLSGSYGIARMGSNQLLEGFIVILYKHYIDLRYYLSILPIPAAFSVWLSRGSFTKK